MQVTFIYVQHQSADINIHNTKHCGVPNQFINYEGPSHKPPGHGWVGGESRLVVNNFWVGTSLLTGIVSSTSDVDT